jgi:O-antigen/teichoic acid export membrane protein
VKGPASSARDASKGSAIRLSAEIVVRSSSIIATLWLTRSLGVSAFGSFLLALSTGLMIAELCDLGLNAIVVPLVVRSRRNLRTLFVMKAFATLGAVALCVLLIPLASRLVGIGASALLLCTLHFLGASWIDMTGAALRALGRRIDEALLLFVFRFTLVGLVIGAPFGVSVESASRAYALAAAPAVLFGAFLLRGGSGADQAPGASIRAIARQAIPMGVNGYLAILSTRVELFLLQAFQGAQVVGLFGGAIRIVESLLTLPTPNAAGALPSVARDVVRGSRGAAQRTFGMVVWIGVPAAFGLALCAPDILSVLGPGFVEASMSLRILALALLLCFANAVLFHLLIAGGDTASVPRLTGLRVSAAAIAGLLLIPSLGSVGASISFTAAEGLLFGALIRKARVHAEVQVVRPLGFALLACLPMVLFLSLGSFPLPVSIPASAFLFAAASAAILRRGTEAGGLA